MKSHDDSEWQHVTGKGIWAEYKNTKTGESTMQEHKMRKISSFDECDHNYTFVADGNIQCKKCGLGARIAWGKQFLKDGKIVSSL